jgi:hypothetical protein
MWEGRTADAAGELALDAAEFVLKVLRSIISQSIHS